MASLAGLVIERTVIRFLYRRPLESLLATWGISLVMQQLFRMVFGANNVQVNSPSWLLGHFSINDIIFGYNRVFVVCFALVIVFATWLLLTKTPLGLLIRAVMQNRAMAASLGVRTARVDMLTFAFGSGLAGLAGAFLSQIGNVGPSLGQSYIVDSFMTVVLGGVGSIVGTVCSAFGIGTVDQVLQQTTGSPVTGKIIVLVAIIMFLQWKPGGLSARAAAAWTSAMQKAGMKSKTRWVVVGVVIATLYLLVLLPGLNAFTAPDAFLHVSDFTINLYGKYLCYAILAVGVDLLWGYTGLLSLGQALFFSLGGYMMGMYLMRMIGDLGQYHQPIPDFLVFLGWSRLPPFWKPFSSFAFAVAMAFALPAALATVFGFLAFRSRIRGVYFSILTQALTYAACLLFFRNSLLMGGNNGFTDFKFILGHDLRAPATQRALYMITAAMLLAVCVACRWLSRTKFGLVQQAIKNSENRVLFSGYAAGNYKLFVFVIGALIAALGGILYVPQVGIINPSEMAPEKSLEAVVWVAVGGARHVGRSGSWSDWSQQVEKLDHARLSRLVALVPRHAVHCRDRLHAEGHRRAARTTLGRLVPLETAKARGAVGRRA